MMNNLMKAMKTIIHVRLVTWRNRFRHLKTLEKDICKELIPVAWHPTSWWDCCMSEDEKK